MSVRTGPRDPRLLPWSRQELTVAPPRQGQSLQQGGEELGRMPAPEVGRWRGEEPFMPLNSYSLLQALQLVEAEMPKVND